jgi:phage major head subunit gpT-like protein
MATPTGQYALLDNSNLIGLFDQMYEAEIAGNWAPTVGNLIQSDGASETYGWLGAAPSLEELKGDMTEEQFAKFSYTLKNVEYAKSLRIAEKDMRRDKLDMIQMRIGELANKAQDHWNSLVSSLITNGATSGYNSYDGTTFFSAVHAESGSNQVNNLTNSHVAALDVTTATAPTADEAAKALTGVLGKFYELTDDKGDPINGTARNFLVMVGTAELWAPFNHAIYGQQLTSGESNRVQGLTGRNGITLDLVLNPRLKAKTANFWVFRTDSVVKPFILQEEVAIDPQVTDRNSDEFKKYRRFVFSVYTSRAAGYGRWQSALQATLS